MAINSSATPTEQQKFVVEGCQTFNVGFAYLRSHKGFTVNFQMVRMALVSENMEFHVEVGGRADANKPQGMKGRSTRHHVIAYILARHENKLNPASKEVVQQRKPKLGIV